MGCIWILVFIFYIYLNKIRKLIRSKGIGISVKLSISDIYGYGMGVIFENGYKYKYSLTYLESAPLLSLSET